MADEVLVTKLLGSINSRQKIRWINLRQWQYSGRVDAAIPISVKEGLAGAKVHHQERLPFEKPVTGHVERHQGIKSA